LTWPITFPSLPVILVSWTASLPKDRNLSLIESIFSLSVAAIVVSSSLLWEKNNNAPPGAQYCFAPD
jgi:hypothetical protein